MSCRRTSPLNFLIIALLLCFFPVLTAHAQTASASLQGVVRDSQGKLLSGATVRLEAVASHQATEALTDAEGKYNFPNLLPGTYSIRAQRKEYDDAAANSISLKADESGSVDLTLKTSQASRPAFYDHPQFTVSGVTDTTSLGGHGSDTVVRARDTLAKETVELGKPRDVTQPASAAIEQSLRAVADHDPTSFEANRKLGRFLIEQGKFHDALAYLERASKLDPDDYQNAFELALANANSGNYARARDDAQRLLQQHDTAKLHHLLADIQEKIGNSLEAVREYERAAGENPSEPYLFDWGAELLLHHAPAPAREVFITGTRAFPRSVRMLIGLGAALFALGSDEQAEQRMCQASDLNPDDRTADVFLGKIDRVAGARSDAVLERLRRFAALRPDSAEANYYYAAALWKRRKNSDNVETLNLVESRLQKAIQIDPQFAVAYLQLGILHSERHQYDKAVADYEQAARLAPNMEETHYRLAQAYRQMGETEKAKAEVEIYDRVSKESAQRADRERREIRQFVYTLRDQPAPKSP